MQGRCIYYQEFSLLLCTFKLFLLLTPLFLITSLNDEECPSYDKEWMPTLLKIRLFDCIERKFGERAGMLEVL